jgi:ABC-type polysaccharide/polyol phosphate export permease
LGAVLMREILTRFGRHNIGFLWLFAEPMIFTLGVLALWSFAGLHHGQSGSIATFAITGYSSVLLWRNMPNRCIGAIGPNLSLLFHRNVRVLDILMARLILEVAGASMSFLILAILFSVVGLMNAPADLLTVLIAWSLLAWFGASVAILMGSLSERSEFIEKLWHPATYILFPLSGAAFTVDALPPDARDVVLLLPMVHGVEMLREGYYGAGFTAHYNLTYLVWFCALTTCVGLALTRSVARNVVPE